MADFGAKLKILFGSPKRPELLRFQCYLTLYDFVSQNLRASFKGSSRCFQVRHFS